MTKCRRLREMPQSTTPRTARATWRPSLRWIRKRTAISWSLSGTDAGVFDISGAGVLTFNESPDYEMSADADADNIYMVTVEASDGTNMASHEVTVTVTDEDDMVPAHSA